MQRREMLCYLGVSMALAALPARARQSLPLIVWFTQADEKTVEPYWTAFRDGMRERGYVEGLNVRIEIFSAQFSRDRAEKLAAEIVAKQPAIIVAQGAAILIVSRLTKTIPLVVGASGDMVEAKLVASLARPGGNVTGVQFLAWELVGKRIELLKELVPTMSRVAVFSDPGHAGESGERAITQAAAVSLGIRMDHYPVRTPAELEAALVTAVAAEAQGLVFFPDVVTFSRRARIAEFARQHRLPAVSGWDAYADAGLVLTYGPNLRAAWARTAYFVDRILKGTKPGDLPAEMPSTYEMIVNQKTARALGIKVPQSILLRADRVIE